MCGIYCCLKCNTDDISSREDTVLPKLRDYLKHRGPDGFSEYAIDVGCKWSVSFAGSVLWMQGLELSMQPLIDDEYNYLLWNGDVFNGLMVNQETLSDTVKISQLFSKGNGTEIPVILSNIQGPYAFIYLDVKRQHLYFGRDRLGRHSLLWTSDSEEGFILTSVGKRNVLHFKEVPAIGIFMIDMNSSEHLHWFELEGNTFPERIVTSDKTWVYSCTPESEPSTMEWHYNGSPLPRKVKTQLSTGKIVADLGPITLYPWSDISAETLLNIGQECVLNVEVSSESIQSPIILDRNNRERPFDSQHPLNQHDTEGVVGIHQIRDFMEKLQSDSDIKKSVEKLINLLRNAIQVRVQTHPGICKECLECAKHMNVKTHAHKLTSKYSNSEYQQEFLQCFHDTYEAQPSETSLTNIEPRSSLAKACMCLEKELTMSHSHSTSLKHTDVEECSQSEPTTCSQEMWTTKTPKLCHHSKVGILFSGGLDSTVLAALADEFVLPGEPIDLLNVAFEREKKERNLNRKAAREKKHVHLSEEKEVTYLVPDRITGKKALDDLKRLYPNRQWNFVQIDVTQEELTKERDRIISDLIYPLNTVLDESLGCALWFASRCKGYLEQQSGPDTCYSSPARVLLLGMGADELFGGYKRHRTAFNLGGWNGLRNELELDLARISTRNLGRDNRIVSDHGCQGRLPYLDESFVSYISSLQPWERCYPKPAFPPGVGDKLLLRLAAWKLGLHYAAVLPKRAFQFGSRIANSREKASDVSSRL